MGKAGFVGSCRWGATGNRWVMGIGFQMVDFGGLLLYTACHQRPPNSGFL